MSESSDRGEAHLLGYRELSEPRGRQQWSVQDLDLTQDRIDWHGRISPVTDVARDEHRHVAFGSRFLRDMARRHPRYGEAIQRTLAEVPAGASEDDELFGASIGETKAFAALALTRRLKVIGLMVAA